jgi:hypothetical protein
MMKHAAKKPPAPVLQSSSPQLSAAHDHFRREIEDGLLRDALTLLARLAVSVDHAPDPNPEAQVAFCTLVRASDAFFRSCGLGERWRALRTSWETSDP